MKKLNFLLIFCYISTILLAEIPAGYYNKANNKFGSELLNTLNIICSSGDFLSYGSGMGCTWEGFYYTDRNEDNSVIDMYSSEIRYQKDFSSVDGLHIEHSLPKSWWGGYENYAYRDLHHLFPADATTNSTKSNLPLGEVIEATFNNGVSKIGTTNIYNNGKCFEPADEYKGDFARAYFYISSTYNELSDLWQSPMMDNNTYPVWNEEGLNLLLKWHREDPVSEKELKRQEAVYQIQHNRNPFIDYPEMIEHIWGNKKNIAIKLPQETRPYLTMPTAWTKIDDLIVYVGATATKTIHFEGDNFTEALTIKLLNNTKSIELSTTTITPQEIISGYNLTISVQCNEKKTIIDTLLICTADTIKIPIVATFTDEFMITDADVVNSVSANITWTEVPNIEEYEVILRDHPNNRTTELMFVGYAEGSSYNKAISIYNGTGKDLDLQYYSLRKQSNGTGALTLDYPLSGILPNGKCYVIVNSRATETLKALADHVVNSSGSGDNIVNFNGNDAVGLYHNGMLIDVIGEINNSANWGKDISLKRTKNIIAPNHNFNWEEWTNLNKDDFSHLNNHEITLSQESNIIATYYSENNSIKINNLAPNSTFYIEIKAGDRTSTNIAKITTTDAPITSATEYLADYTYYTTYNGIYINDITQASQVRLYTITGLKIYDDITSNDIFIPVDKPNIYILQITNNQTTKTIKLIIR